ncbi:COG2426 family protein [Patescibacteria group bacterium]
MVIPPEIIILIISAVPISELRGAIPLAIGVYNFSPWSAFVLAVIGNIIPIIFLLWLLGWISDYLSHHFYYFNRFFAWLFKRTREKHSNRFEIWGSLALVLFVAIPLPMTGGWSGAVAAFVFGIPFKKAFPLICLGIIIAGIIVTLGSIGIFGI